MLSSRLNSTCGTTDRSKTPRRRVIDLRDLDIVAGLTGDYSTKNRNGNTNDFMVHPKLVKRNFDFEK